MHKAMQALNDRIEAWTGMTPALQEKLFWTLLIIALVIAARWSSGRIIKRQPADPRRHYYWRKTTNAVTAIVAVVLLIRVWVGGIAGLGTYLGLVTAGLTIALKDPIANLAGWLYITWQRPFQIGDRIEIGDVRGDVVGVGMGRISMLEVGNWVHADQTTGRILYLPNSKVLTEKLANYTAGFQYIWNEIDILITFESDWQKAKEILNEVAQEKTKGEASDAERQVRESAKKFVIVYSNFTPIVYTTVEDSGVRLSVRYLTAPRRRRDTRQIIWEEVLHRFAEHDDIDFAYPTKRVYYNALEGKLGTRPPDMTAPPPGETPSGALLGGPPKAKPE